MEHASFGNRTWKGVAKKLICAAATAALASAMVPAAALATDSTGTYYVQLPKANEVIDFEHTGNDNGADYQYEYVTIGSSATGRVAPMMQTWYETVGLNYVNAYNGPGSIYNANNQVPDESLGYSAYTKGDKGSLQSNNSTLVIMGSANNEAPDEYIWNYCCWANGAEVAEDSRAVDHGNTGTGAISLDIDGTTYADFPREVYMECNIIAAADSSAMYNEVSWADWVNLENQRANRPKKKNYDPYFTTYSVSGAGASASVAGLHTLADTIDKVIAESKDENGNYTLQSRYGGNCANGTGAAIDKFEDIVLGTQYYVLSKIADKTVEKKTTAVLVGYDPKTGNYACRKYETDKDPNGNQYGGRVTNYLASISTSITEKLGDSAKAQSVTESAEEPYVVWYTPEQIVENCDAAFVCDCYSSNSVSTYLATASEGNDQKCYTVYSPAGVSRAEEDNTADLKAAINKAKANGKDTCDFCFSYPANMFGNFYAQGSENGLLSVICSSFTYPELDMNLTDMLAYWAKNVWHIKSSALQTVVTATCGDMNLSGDTQIGTVSSNYAAEAEAIFTAGNSYYLDNRTTIDQMNGGNLKTFDYTSLLERTREAEKNAVAAELEQAKKAAAEAAANSNAKQSEIDAANARVAQLEKELAAAKAAASKKSQTLTVSKLSKTYKVSKLKKKAKSFKISVKGNKGKLTYKVTKKDSKKKVTFKNGKVTVKKGTKAGTYKVKVKVTAAAKGNYTKASKTVTIKVKVKK